MKEKWKDIKGFEDYYQISNKGQVKSLPRNHRYGSKVEKILKGRPDKNGYLRIGLSKDGIVEEYRIHRLVALNFISNPHNKPEVNHKNGIKNDNRVENLEWVTPKENSQHSWDTGLSKFTEKTRIALSEANKNRIVSNETKEKMRNARLGKSLSEETKLKLSLIGKNKIMSDKAKEKIRQSKLGKSLSEETKQKIRESKLGKNISEETKLKLSLIGKNKIKNRDANGKFIKQN